MRDRHPGDAIGRCGTPMASVPGVTPPPHPKGRAVPGGGVGCAHPAPQENQPIREANKWHAGASVRTLHNSWAGEMTI